MNKDITKKQNKFYSDLLKEKGFGVDAVASKHQTYKELRYDKLSQVFRNDNNSFSLHDVGFGLGHYYEFLKKKCHNNRSFTYSGSEVTTRFVEESAKLYPECNFICRDIAEQPYDDHYDYLIFAGTFYHLIDTTEKDFTKYIEALLTNAFIMCDRGLAFNFITSYVEYKKPGLFYGDIQEIINFIVKKLSRFFTIDHSYPLYEYTICVYKEDYIHTLHPDELYEKYFKCIT